jgi:putative Holliday junction resolvase
VSAPPVTTDPELFAIAVGQGRRLLGLDIGTRTIGLATATADWGFATARATIGRRRWAEDLAALRRFVEADGIGGLVVGLPLNMDGSDSPRTQSVRATARNLARDLGLPVLLWDERWSTAAVEREMIAADLSRARRAERVDRLAAAHILEGALARLARHSPGA